MYMAGQIGGIGHNDIISQPAIVRDVTVSHQKVIISYDSHPDVGGCGPVDGHIFPDCIVVPDNNPSLFPLEFQVLGACAD
jgi:hypothetical protein